MITPITLACSTCRASMIEAGGDAAGYSIFFLLIVILAVLSGIGYAMFRLARGESENLDPELRDDYVRN